MKKGKKKWLILAAGALAALAAAFRPDLLPVADVLLDAVGAP